MESGSRRKLDESRETINKMCDELGLEDDKSWVYSTLNSQKESKYSHAGVYSQMYNDKYKKWMKEKNLEDSNLTKALFYVDQSNHNNEQWRRENEAVNLYISMKEKGFDRPEKYAQTYNDDYKKWLKKNQVEDNDLSKARFFKDESYDNNEQWRNRLSSI